MLLALLLYVDIEYRPVFFAAVYWDNKLRLSIFKEFLSEFLSENTEILIIIYCILGEKNTRRSLLEKFNTTLKLLKVPPDCRVRHHNIMFWNMWWFKTFVRSGCHLCKQASLDRRSFSHVGSRDYGSCCLPARRLERAYLALCCGLSRQQRGKT